MRKRRYIFDSVCLSNFVQAEASDILAVRYKSRAFISSEVLDELSSAVPCYPRLRSVEHLIDSSVFQLTTLTRQEHMRFTELICYLGKGESSCIAMAKQRKMTVVTDDKAARNTCRQLNVPVTGTIGILKSSCIDHQLSVQDADSILAKMIGNGYYAPVQRISDIV